MDSWSTSDEQNDEIVFANQCILVKSNLWFFR